MCFFFHATSPTEISTLSLHDALPIFGVLELLEGEARDLGDDIVDRRLEAGRRGAGNLVLDLVERVADGELGDRKSTRLNSSHLVISYAVFCLKKNTSKRQYTCNNLRP